MSISQVVADRGIREVLHFTTNEGLCGMLHERAIKSRQRLKQSEQLEFILKLNTPIVKDAQWIDYVNFSLTRINLTLYHISSNHWHTDAWWRILAFDPVILEHPGVVFTTTNNIFPSVIRARGCEGLKSLFAEQVYGRYQEIIGRGPAHLPSLPTCEQAEVLYPQALDITFLRRIYVPTGEDADIVHAQISALNLRGTIEVVVNPNKFRGHVD